MRGGHAIGVDVGGTKILAGAVEADGTVRARLERATPRSGAEALLEALAAVVEELAGVVGAGSGVGLGIPSRVDVRRGVAMSSNNVPLHDVPVRDTLAARLGMQVTIDNDATVAALAESRLGAGRGVADAAMLTVGTGVGGGLVLGGRLYRGAVGAAGEVGHVVVVYGGLPCFGACTGRGHLEAYVSGTVADGHARRILGPDADARDLLRAADEGHVDAAAAFEEMGSYLGTGIATIVNTLDVELVVIGGGFGTAAGERLLGPARPVAARESARLDDPVPIVAAELGADAGMVGAALVALDSSAAARDAGRGP